MNELRQNALHWLACSQVVDKVAGVTALNFAWQAGDVCLDASIQLTANQAIPGHPSKPVLVSPLAVEKRSMRTLEGRAALIHAIAHIEFNLSLIHIFGPSRPPQR